MTKTKTRSRIVSILLVLMMLLTMVPITAVTANAAEWTTVNSYEELQTAVKAKKEYIKLGRDIDTTNFHYSGSGITIDEWLTFEGQTCTLDLNGKTLTLITKMRNMGTFMRVYSGSNLTIKDSSSTKTGEITCDFDANFSGDNSAYMIHVSESSLTLEGGTFRATSHPYATSCNAIQSIDSNLTIKDGVKLIQPDYFDGGGDSVETGSGYALRAELNKGNTSKIIIDGGEFDGCVKLTGSQAENGSVQINGGTFKKDVQVLYKAEKNNSNPAVAVNGGTFEGNVYFQGWPWKKSLYMPYRLNGGTFYGSLNLCQDSNMYASDNPKESLNIALGLNECFGYSAIAKHDGVFTAGNIHNAIDWETQSLQYWVRYKMLLKGSNTNPVRIIPNAWGMKSVTLDGNPIDYAKDWNGTVERMDNSTAHTLKFEWYPLAQELKDAGYTYRANFDCYTVGSNTPTTSVPISATATEYSHTISAGEAPSLYPFDLQLNLDKNGSSVGIMSNEHIVKLVVNPAPVVTEISSAPVRLSAALTPGTSAPSATAVGSGYTVDSIKWYTDSGCNTPASAFVAGTKYYGKIVLKPAENYKFAASASALFFCDDPNENYSIVGSSTVAENGSSLTLVVKGTAVSALKWDSVDKTNQTYTIGDSALMLNAKAVGGDSSKPITYKLIAKKGGTETVKASATVAASSTEGFSAPLRFTETGSYECWFEATRGNVTITSDHFTVTVNAPGLSISNQSGDLTVKQNATARLFVKAVGHGVNYQWQVKNGGAWNAISGETAYDYAAPTTNVGEKTYRCKVTDKYGATKYTNEMTVTVTAVADSSLTPAILLAAVNGDAPDPAKLWPDKDVEPNGWLGLKAEYDVTAGDTFHGVATFSTIPTGFNMNGHDIYYDSYNNIQKTPVLGTISYEWEGTTKNPWEATSGDFTSLGTDAHASFTIPSGVNTYYVKLSVKNTVGTETQISTVYITFHVSAAHTHTYAYAQLNKDQHTKYCTAGDDSITETHTMENGVCKYCGYAPAKTYSVTVTGGSANHSTNVAPGTKVTLTANTAPSGQEFDKWVGNVTVASDNTFTMPSHDVTVAATYKPIAHTHDTDAQPWVYMDPGTHIKTCTAGDDFKVEAHEFTPWTDNGNGTHSRHCTVCKMTDGSTYTETAEHTWVWVVDQEAALNQPGKQHEECTGCHAKRNENTEIPALRDYAVTVTGGTATVAAGTPITRAMEGVEVTVTAQAPDGKHFLKWVVKAGGVTLANETSATTTFIMPANDVTIEAECAENPVESYTLTVIKGTASVAAGTPITDKIEQNTVVTVKADAPETGKVFDKWVVLEGNFTLADAAKATTTFTMPANDVKLEATYKDATSSHTHSYGTDWKYDGTNHWHECQCGDKADVAAHSASEWIVDTAATETAVGAKHKECTVCKKVLETATIPATGSTHTHSYGADWMYDGTNHWHECKCGDKADIAAHSASEWIVDKAATETAVGAKHKECTVCKKVLETATIPATGSTHTHSYGTDWMYDSTNHWHECECGDEADTAAHNFQWVIDKAATKEATGIKHEECTVCGAKRSENTVIDKLPDGGNTGNTDSGDNNTDKPGKDDSTKSPQTGDSSNLIGWLAALFVSGGVLTVLGLNSKKRKESEAE